MVAELTRIFLAFCQIDSGKLLVLCIGIASSVLSDIPFQPRCQFFVIPLTYFTSTLWWFSWYLCQKKCLGGFNIAAPVTKDVRQNKRVHGRANPWLRLIPQIVNKYTQAAMNFTQADCQKSRGFGLLGLFEEGPPRSWLIVPILGPHFSTPTPLATRSLVQQANWLWISLQINPMEKRVETLRTRALPAKGWPKQIAGLNQVPKSLQRQRQRIVIPLGREATETTQLPWAKRLDPSKRTYL